MFGIDVKLIDLLFNVFCFDVRSTLRGFNSLEVLRPTCGSSHVPLLFGYLYVLCAKFCFGLVFRLELQLPSLTVFMYIVL